MSTRVTFRRLLVWAMGLLVAAFVAGLVLPGGADSVIVYRWLGTLTMCAPTAVCWLAVTRVGFRRWDVLLAAGAVTFFAAGATYYLVMVAAGGSLPFPSLGDVGYLLFYLLMLAALVVAVRHHSRGLASSVWLDCAVGSLGAASVLAIVLSPVLASAVSGSLSLATAVAVAYPMFDLLFVAAIAGIAAGRGLRMGHRWSLLVAGLLVFTATDVIYALQVSVDTYAVGTPLDAGWAIGLALISMWVDGAAQPDGSTRQTREATGAGALVVSTAAAIAGLGVLVASSQTKLSKLAVVLATVALLAATARTQVAFRLLARMADLRHRTATTDELTGLPNRRVLYAQGRARLVDPGHWRQALLMLDLDRFKDVNDSLGHHAGDLLLVQVGARLSEQLRPDDLLVRLGGDEFAVLLNDASREQAIAVSAKLCAALTKPFDLEDITVHSAVSIGIALFPEDGPDLSTLLRKADVAMYKAKASGGHGHHVYGGDDEADFTTRLRTVEEVRTALTSDQFVVHYQPKIDLGTGEVHSVEALVRWNHPTRGLLYPDAFLDLIEEAGLMHAMTRVVLAIALDQGALWHADGRHLTIAVNLSASSLVDTDLPDQVAAMLAARDLPPGALQLEITEEFLMADRDLAKNILTRLRDRGIQISVDDFGTGYNSLSYLRDLPIDELKLDRSLILPMIDDPRAAALVASTISLAHSLDLRMVAEGVENNIAYTKLTALGCDQAQGYYMSRPVPAAELDYWLDSRRVTDELTNIPN